MDKKYKITKEKIKYAREHYKDALEHPEKYTDEQCAEMAANLMGDTILNACKPKYKHMTFNEVKDFINKSNRDEIYKMCCQLKELFDQCVAKGDFAKAKALEIASLAMLVWHDAKDIIGFERKYKS